MITFDFSQDSFMFVLLFIIAYFLSINVLCFTTIDWSNEKREMYIDFCLMYIVFWTEDSYRKETEKITFNRDLFIT